MANVVCENCRCEFDSDEYSLADSGVSTGAMTGALLGARIGIRGGLWGAIGAAIPGAVIGGLLVGAGAANIIKCPCCDETSWR